MKGRKRLCDACHQPLPQDFYDKHLSSNPVTGPRNITSGNIDRVFQDDRQNRFLFIEEKDTNEREMGPGQWYMLAALAQLPGVETWVVKGSVTDSIAAYRFDTWYRIEHLPDIRDYGSYQNAVHRWYEADRLPGKSLKVLPPNHQNYLPPGGIPS